jgi:UDP-N-acetylmuramate: L-alanyl-gamma-D-glutamyl-meso-diaminopimelate ligase
LVASAHDAHVIAIARCEVRGAFTRSEATTHGAPPHWLAEPVAGTNEFDLFVGGVSAGRSRLAVPGEHNLRNALAALAACCQGFGVSVKTALAALETFAGVRRRQDLLYVASGISVYDDFAHHPTAVRETLAALRQKHPTGALWAVFEPRSATACRSLQAEYESSFDSAERVLFAPLGRSDIPEAERLDLEFARYDRGSRARSQSRRRHHRDHRARRRPWRHGRAFVKQCLRWDLRKLRVALEKEPDHGVDSRAS